MGEIRAKEFAPRYDRSETAPGNVVFVNKTDFDLAELLEYRVRSVKLDRFDWNLLESIRPASLDRDTFDRF